MSKSDIYGKLVFSSFKNFSSANSHWLSPSKELLSKERLHFQGGKDRTKKHFLTYFFLKIVHFKYQSQPNNTRTYFKVKINKTDKALNGTCLVVPMSWLTGQTMQDPDSSFVIGPWRCKVLNFNATYEKKKETKWKQINTAPKIQR